MKNKNIKEGSEVMEVVNRLKLFADFITDFVNKCQEYKLTSDELKKVSNFALKDGPITYSNSNSLAEIDVQDLSDAQLNIIIKRARTALKRTIEMKKKYVVGPFYSNRHHRRMMKCLSKHDEN